MIPVELTTVENNQSNEDETNTPRLMARSSEGLGRGGGMVQQYDSMDMVQKVG